MNPVQASPGAGFLIIHCDPNINAIPVLPGSHELPQGKRAGHAMSKLHCRHSVYVIRCVSWFLWLLLWDSQVARAPPLTAVHLVFYMFKG